jgi:hypothetical protein
MVVVMVMLLLLLLLLLMVMRPTTTQHCRRPRPSPATCARRLYLRSPCASWNDVGWTCRSNLCSRLRLHRRRRRRRRRQCGHAIEWLARPLLLSRTCEVYRLHYSLPHLVRLWVKVVPPSLSRCLCGSLILAENAIQKKFVQKKNKNQVHMKKLLTSVTFLPFLFCKSG